MKWLGRIFKILGTLMIVGAVVMLLLTGEVFNSGIVLMSGIVVVANGMMVDVDR